MPSAYLLARDQIEQARAMLTNEIWYDPETDHLFELALNRLDALDAALARETGLAPGATRMPQGRKPRTRLMPWLDR